MKQSPGQKRFHAFMREAKREGNTHKDALKIYRYYAATIGETPKRGEFQKYHHLVKEALTAPPPVKTGKTHKFKFPPAAPPPAPRSAAAGAGGGGASAGAGAIGPNWYEEPDFEQAFEEGDEDIYG